MRGRPTATAASTARSGTKAVKGRDGSGALSFDGTDDYVEFPSAVTADIQGQQRADVCLWAVINSFSSDGSEYDLGAGLFDYGDYSDLENFALRVHGTDGSLRVQLWGADTDVALSGPATATGIALPDLRRIGLGPLLRRDAGGDGDRSVGHGLGQRAPPRAVLE
ncbi:hypothetical protein SO694_0000916 [Aureococcus anophagefferens]|uniref:Uncharacterized protein n=1 Tax=Aureococcus anophagefferens TaxID=44056 RepID=A0ABR1GDS7_AURAN